MSGSGKESTTIRAAGGPCPGPRLPSPAAGSRPWRPLLVVLVVAAMLMPLGVAATGCSSKPAARKRGKGATAAKRPETGLAELAGTEGSQEGSQAPPAAGTEAAEGDPAPNPAAEGVAQPAAADAAPTKPGADAADGAADPAPAGAPLEPAASAEPMPSEASEPAPVDPASPAPSLGDLSAAGADSANRPTSKLVDADTALRLDGGRVEVCSPLGWTRSPRSQNYLVRYQPGPKKSYPSIVVTAEPAPAGLGEITAANQPDLVAAIGTKLAATFPAGGLLKLIKKPAAATFGSHKGVAWALPGTAKVGGLSEPVDRFAYGVVLGGRLYTVEARAPKGKVDDDAKAAAKAVAATLFRPAEAPAGNPEGAAPATPEDEAPPAAN
ncbi:MAG: hypothetical protein RLZZ326_744 [Planctomycetota bacterium]